MTSNDNPQYITVELFNSKMETFIPENETNEALLQNRTE